MEKKVEEEMEATLIDPLITKSQKKEEAAAAAAAKAQRYAAAYKFFTKADKGGNAEGMNGRGYMHLHGLGVEKSYHIAKTFFERAAQHPERRSVNAIYNMGAMYLLPIGAGGGGEKVTEDYDEKRGGNEEEREEREERDGSPGFDFQKALAHFRVAAKAGHVQAMHKLGQMIIHGIGMKEQETSERKSERKMEKRRRRDSTEGSSNNDDDEKKKKKRKQRNDHNANNDMNGRDRAREKRRVARCEEAVRCCCFFGLYQLYMGTQYIHVNLTLFPHFF